MSTASQVALSLLRMNHQIPTYLIAVFSTHPSILQHHSRFWIDTMSSQVLPSKESATQGAPPRVNRATRYLNITIHYPRRVFRPCRRKRVLQILLAIVLVFIGKWCAVSANARGLHVELRTDSNIFRPNYKKRPPSTPSFPISSIIQNGTTTYCWRIPLKYQAQASTFLLRLLPPRHDATYANAYCQPRFSIIHHQLWSTTREA